MSSKTISKNRVLAGIVLYNPDLEKLSEEYSHLDKQVGQIVLIDNGSDNIEEIRYWAAVRNGIHLVENGVNLGVAHALNQIAHKAIDMGFDYFLTLDQDSLIPINLIHTYSVAAQNVDNQDIAIFCPRAHDVNSGQTTGSNEDEIVNRCITSGALNLIEAYSQVGGFDDWLFIDEVDHDYCYRLKESGWSILRVGAAIIDHSMGHIERKYVMGIEVPVRNYSAFRKYYQARNRIVTAKRHGCETTTSACVAILKWIITGLIFESRKTEKTIALLRGTIDGLKYDIKDGF